MKKARQEKPARKIELPVMKTGAKAGEGTWWKSVKSWFKENAKPVT